MPYLAMTAAEMRRCGEIPKKPAWMACHFSPYGTGLTNLPRQLPENALLILNDRTPVSGHDPDLVAETLAETAQRLQCRGILLELQRPGSSEAACIAAAVAALDLPVCVSAEYAQGLPCAVFVPPVPLLTPVGVYLQPWQGREIWLECDLGAGTVTLTEDGSTFSDHDNGIPCPHFDEDLLLHYGMTITKDRAEFTLRRTKEDLHSLIAAARANGVTECIGLWQELAGECV